jgi:ABC-2 type transport system ATP-binding protein
VELAVQATGLSKRFGATVALDGLDLRVRRGSVVGLLGPNGAGKTTTVRVLATLLRADRGEARVLGHDVRASPQAVRQRIALTGQFASVDEDLTGRENLRLLGRLLGLGVRGARRRADEMLERFDLTEAAGRQAKAFSGGMRRRLDIAASLLVTPELLFLDEPTTGLDPRSRNGVWAIVRELTATGVTVLLTTQYLEEADQLAERVVVIDHGRVIAEGTPDELKASVGAGSLQVRLAEAGQRNQAAAVLRQWFGEDHVHEPGEPRRLTATLDDPQRAAAALVALREAGVTVSEFSMGRPSLDEVFFALTGHGAEQTQGAASPHPPND